MELDKKEEVIVLKAQKSSFYNQLILLIPDLRLDFPEAVGKWDDYLFERTEEQFKIGQVSSV